MFVRFIFWLRRTISAYSINWLQTVRCETITMALIEEIDDSTEQTVKKQMTDEERLALADKLDKELDDFINGLEKRGYTEGWPEDRWEEVSREQHWFLNDVSAGSLIVSLRRLFFFSLSGNGQTSILHEGTTKTRRRIASNARRYSATQIRSNGEHIRRFGHNVQRGRQFRYEK